jgi:lipopolysaccharide export system permease protein
MHIIDRYILKSLVGPFFLSFATIVFVLVLQFLAGFSDRFLGKGIGLADIVELVVLQSAWMVVFAVPMAVLVSVIMTYGAMTNNSEITVLRASGLSLFRLAAPVLVVAALLTLFVERFNNVVLPEANYRARVLMADIVRAKPAFGLTENAFSSFIDGYSIFVKDTDEASREMRGVLLYDLTRPGYRTMVSAERGLIGFAGNDRYLIMTLYNGEIHEMRYPSLAGYRTMSFARHRLVFESSGFGFTRSGESRFRGDARDLSATELLAAARQQERKIKVAGNPALFAENDRQRLAAEQVLYNRYMTEYHKKYALPVACLVFALAGVPLGVLARRGGFGAGAGLSLLFFVLYWSMVITGEKLAERGILDPAAASWSGDVILALVAFLMIHRLNGLVAGTSR